MITEEQFAEWRMDPVTKAVLEMVASRIREETETLATSAGRDPSLDCMRVGRIQGYKALLEIDYDD